MIDELCFNLLFKRSVVYDSDQLLDSLINFAIENNISIGGSSETGACFCSETRFDIEIIKEKFINYMREEHIDKVKAIIFKDYDEVKDEFLTVKEIIL